MDSAPRVDDAHTRSAADPCDAQIVARALERWLDDACDGFCPRDRIFLGDLSRASAFIPLATATIPVRIQFGPNADWTCTFVFDLPQIYDDGTVEYRVRREPANPLPIVV